MQPESQAQLDQPMDTAFEEPVIAPGPTPSGPAEASPAHVHAQARAVMRNAKEAALRFERKAEEAVQVTTKKLVHKFHERPGAGALAAGGAAFVLAATVGAAEVAVAAAGAYAAYRWLGSSGASGSSS